MFSDDGEIGVTAGVGEDREPRPVDEGASDLAR